jgi:predicted nucleic acid-binding protein
VIVVVDASAAVDLLLNTPAAPAVRGAMAAADGLPVAPAHVDAEVFGALARLNRGGSITVDEVSERLALWARLPLERLPVHGLFGDAWALRDNVSARDALYVASARRLQGALLTTDAALAAAAVAVGNIAVIDARRS